MYHLYGCWDSRAQEEKVRRNYDFGFHALLLVFCALGVVLVSGVEWKFVLGCVPLIFGLPLNLVAGASLYSKLLPMPVQGNASLMVLYMLVLGS